MTSGPLLFPIVAASTVVTAVWFGGLYWFYRKDRIEGRAPNQESGIHILWAALIPIPLFAYFLWTGVDDPITGPQLFVHCVLGELLGGAILFCFHEAVWGNGLNRIERPILMFGSAALFLAGVGATFFI